MEKIEIGIIGGSGIYQLENMKVLEEREIQTPFGMPSDKFIIGEIAGVKFAFLSRHGRGHRILPGELNSRANIYGFKMLGVKYLISFNAVGSLREEIEPSHMVFPDQIIDRTKNRVGTFFGEGIVAHAGFAEPVCACMVKIFEESSEKLKIHYHSNKTYVCMEGPLFSTKAESNFHRQIGGDVIGMTAIPEAKLAREAEMCYGIIALSTDYDCWRENEEAVNVEMVLSTIKRNIESAKKLISDFIPKFQFKECKCHKALENTIMTDKTFWPEATKKKLNELIKRFL